MQNKIDTQNNSNLDTQEIKADEFDSFLEKANEKNCKVKFIRLPLHEKLIDFENKKCSFFN